MGLPVSTSHVRARAIGRTLVVIGTLTGMLLGCGNSGASADCEGVSIDAVRSAARNVDGFTYTATGTDELVVLILHVGDPPAYEFEPAQVEVVGAYRAPDAARIEIETGLPPERPKRSSLFDTWLSGVDAYIRIGEDAWARTIDGGYFPVPEGALYPTPNLLVALLSAAAFPMEIPQEAWQESSGTDLAWDEPTPNDGSCRLVGHPTRDPGLEGFAVEVRVDANVDTNLPEAISIEVNVPDPGNAWAFSLAFQFGYENLPAIDPPPATSSPTSGPDELTASTKLGGGSPARRVLR